VEEGETAKKSGVRTRTSVVRRSENKGHCALTVSPCLNQRVPQWLLPSPAVLQAINRLAIGSRSSDLTVTAGCATLKGHASNANCANFAVFRITQSSKWTGS
jgi:hypothetical protein